MLTDRPDQIAVSTLAVCPGCLVAQVEVVHGVIAEETGEAFDVVACPHCGLGQTRPTPVDLAPYYASTYYGNRHGLTARLCRRRRLGLVRRWAGEGSGKTLLDYGCGDWDFARAARAAGWFSVGIERHRPDQTAGDVLIAPSLDALSDPAAFACVTFWHVLEHLDDPVATLEAVRARLQPGGVVLAAVPNFASWQSRLTGASWLHLDLPRHLWHFTPSGLTRTFEAAGFKVEDVTFGEFEYDLIGWSQSLLNRFWHGRNEFFKVVSGRPIPRSNLHSLLQIAAGINLSVLAMAPTLLETISGHGGTLIIAARNRE